jgi:hypothetical protein
MQWIKAGAVGALGSLLMFILMMLAIHGAGIAPFNMPPSAAFLETLGMNVGPLPLLAHFGYGIFWSIVFVAAFKSKMNIGRGLALAGVLWLGMMLIHSPMIGWGVFGFGAVERAADHALHLGSPVKYIVATALLHVLYGLTIGWLNPFWIGHRQTQASGQAVAAS